MSQTELPATDVDQRILRNLPVTIAAWPGRGLPRPANTPRSLALLVRVADCLAPALRSSR